MSCTSGNDSQSSLTPRAPQCCAACNGPAPHLDTVWAWKHIRGMSLSVLQLTPFSHHHKHNLYSTHILSLERKYIHILIEIKIQTYCKKLNRATARCAVGTLLSVRTDEESKKIFLAWSPTPLHINCALPEILPLVYHIVYRTIFRTAMENQPD